MWFSFYFFLSLPHSLPLSLSLSISLPVLWAHIQFTSSGVRSIGVGSCQCWQCKRNEGCRQSNKMRKCGQFYIWIWICIRNTPTGKCLCDFYLTLFVIVVVVALVVYVSLSIRVWVADSRHIREFFVGIVFYCSIINRYIFFLSFSSSFSRYMLWFALFSTLSPPLHDKHMPHAQYNQSSQGSQCNQAIMLITDGTSDTHTEVRIYIRMFGNAMTSHFAMQHNAEFTL